MRRHLSILVMVVSLGLVTWSITRGHGTTTQVVAAPAPAPVAAPALVPVPAPTTVPVEIVPAPWTAPRKASATSRLPEAIPAARATELSYIAAIGDTVSNMAGAFLGGDDKAHKDAIINANASLQADPDRVVVGRAYRIPVPNGMSGSADSSRAQAPRTTVQPDADDLVLAGAPRVLR